MREHSVCGISRDLKGNKILIFGGGDESFDAQKSVDIFNFATRTWSAGKDLPYALTGPANVPYGDTFLTVGGDLSFNSFCTKLMIFDIPSQSFKQLENVKLSSQRFKPVALLVPNSFTC